MAYAMAAILQLKYHHGLPLGNDDNQGHQTVCKKQDERSFCLAIVFNGKGANSRAVATRMTEDPPRARQKRMRRLQPPSASHGNKVNNSVSHQLDVRD